MRMEIKFPRSRYGNPNGDFRPRLQHRLPIPKHPHLAPRETPPLPHSLPLLCTQRPSQPPPTTTVAALPLSVLAGPLIASSPHCAVRPLLRRSPLFSSPVSLTSSAISSLSLVHSPLVPCSRSAQLDISLEKSSDFHKSSKVGTEDNNSASTPRDRALPSGIHTRTIGAHRGASK
ncbi:uncharacterized protein LOC130949057 [Arachis stenosperma]|uniref:uncharacterized protein LOC130949057 n=1 Tax=Arachis stenosperma TaxID=217475 RepID=UPI0025ACAEFF|nr:uncharacterized protein LOC130949057 [Arachis stenosperma]